MIQSLHVAQTGLYASKVSVENVMNNISNENTVGYKKRVANLAELAHSDSRVYGRGVSVESVTRTTNMFMYDNLIKEESKENYLNELSTMLSDIESVFYETDESGFSNDLDRFFQSIENLRSNPQNQIYKNNLAEQSKILVETMQTLYAGIEDREKVTRNTAYETIGTVNSILEDIGKINEQIGQRLVEPNDLLDKRDALEQELAKYIDIEVDRTDDYQLKIGGQVAVRYSTNIHNVQVVENKTPQKDYYDKSNFASFSSGDSITYYLDNGLSETVTFGEAFGAIDLDNDGTIDLPAGTVDNTNYMRVLVNKINQNNEMSGFVTAYNGEKINEDGSYVHLNTTSENDLVIYSNINGQGGEFRGNIVFHDSSSNTKNIVAMNENKSKIAVDDFHIEIFDQELTLKSGSLKAMTENLDSESGENLFKKYKDLLNTIASSLSNVTAGYVSNGGTGYNARGLKDSSIYTGVGNYNEIKLFTGATVKSFAYNDAANNLTQAQLDYLATIQWNESINFVNVGSNENANTSFTKFYQTLQVSISADKENVDFRFETQSAVKESLKSSYDKLVKVDKDEEMINLIQFQAAYEANAKIVTVVDEMLQTILGMKR